MQRGTKAPACTLRRPGIASRDLEQIFLEVGPAAVPLGVFRQIRSLLTDSCIAAAARLTTTCYQCLPCHQMAFQLISSHHPNLSSQLLHRCVNPRSIVTFFVVISSPRPVCMPFASLLRDPRTSKHATPRQKHRQAQIEAQESKLVNEKTWP